MHEQTEVFEVASDGSGGRRRRVARATAAVGAARAANQVVSFEPIKQDVMVIGEGPGFLDEHREKWLNAVAAKVGRDA